MTASGQHLPLGGAWSTGSSAPDTGPSPTVPWNLGTERFDRSVESECGAVAVGRTYRLPPLSSGGASLVRPWLRFHTPLIEPDVQIYRVAQPLLAFAPTEPAVRRYRSGLFREDRRLLLTHVG